MISMGDVGMPTLSITQRSIEFNENWTFHLGDVVGAEQIGFDDTAWRKLNLPHDWSIEQDFTFDVPETLGHLPGGIGWYRKAFILPKELEKKRIRIHFGGVYMDSDVYLNGHLLGNYPYGYIPFSYDLTEHLICDGATQNILAVKVVNPTEPGAQSSRWYSGSGIYRAVHLSVTDPVQVVPYGVVITTPDIEQEYDGGAVTVQMTTTLRNLGDADANLVVRQRLLPYADAGEIAPPVETAEFCLPAGGQTVITQSLVADHPRLWSPDAPNLYNLRTEVLVNGQVVDDTDARFGFRWFAFDANEGFSLNGQYTKLRGVCLHHDQGALGAVANEAAIARQLRIMKEMGANAIRVTHNPADDALLRQCDEQGLMVIEEAFDTWYYGKNPGDYGRFFEKTATHPEANGTTWAQYDLQQMVRRGINFPCIILWSLGNEVFQSKEEKGIETVKDLIRWVKAIDTTRPTTMGEDKFRDNAARDSVTAPYTKIAHLVDVVGFNYGSKRYDEYRALYPDWIVYGSEVSSAIKSRGYYAEPQKTNGAADPVPHQISSYDNRAVDWGVTASESLKADRDRKWVAGQFVWTGFDYIGEPTPYFGQTAIPKSSYFGIVDTAGFAKDEYYLYQSQWLDVNTHPMVHILPHWNWEDDTLRAQVTVDGKIPVRVYTNAPTVELFLDGVTLGEQSFAVKTTHYGMTYYENAENAGLYLEWPIPYIYRPGCELVAVAKDVQGREIARDRMVTAGRAAGLKLSADRESIAADGKDLAFVTVEVVDQMGNLVPTAHLPLQFTLTGEGEIVGVDNGDASSWERYKDTDGVWKRKAFNGKALVIIRSEKQAGTLTLTAETGDIIATKRIIVRP